MLLAPGQSLRGRARRPGHGVAAMPDDQPRRAPARSMRGRAGPVPSGAGAAPRLLVALGEARQRVGRLTAVAAGAAGEVMAGEALVYDAFDDEEAFEPSHDLRELARAQLRAMFAVLSRLASAASVRACVYARRAESLGSPHIRLQRVACWPPRASAGGAAPGAGGAAPGAGGAAAAPPPGAWAGDGGSSYDELDDLLTLHRPAWEGADTESSLCQEEVVVLPNSNLLVLPLSEAGVLVGLLVVEAAPVAAARRGGDDDDAAAGLPDDALWCLRTAVPALAKGCAMDLRAALAGAQLEARDRLARSLLVQARGPLKVLGTFGQMLTPRLRAELAGQPEPDMAEGMVLQGQRLAEVVAALEAALRPAAGPGGARQQLALPVAGGGAAWAGEAADELREGAADARGDGRRALPPPPGARRGLPERSSVSGVSSSGSSGSSGSSSSSSAGDGSAAGAGDAASAPGGDQQQQQAVVVHLPGQGTAARLEQGRRDVRWSGVQADAPGAATPATCTAFYAAGSDVDATRTIDLEPAGSSASSAGSAGSAATVLAPSWSLSSSGSSDGDGGGGSDDGPGAAAPAAPSRRERRQQALPTAPGGGGGAAGSCNVIEALQHLLTAAAAMARAQGVNLVVSHPLQLDAAGGAPPAQQRGAAPGDGGGAVALRPPPVRPLLVGVAAATARRVLGHVVDVALQCCPRGGQLCVSARQSGGGVEVQLLHTGQVQPGRLHTTSRAFAPRDEAGGGASLKPSASLVSLDFAGSVLAGIGGRLSVAYPTSFINAISGQLETGTSICCWLPPPAPSAA
ncbi:hypothetical protein HT031_002147 [Scenedesmus sp. PABB004]|nr:hypothetical protein HT031_002147 [Scenedesmus sp. PABB004]